MTRLQLKNLSLTIALTLIAVSGALAQQSTQPQSESAKVETPTEDKSAEFAAQLDKFARRKVAAQKYALEYKFKKGDVIQWKHDHRTVIKTRSGAATENTSTRAQPDFKWTVRNVDSRGTIRFDIEMERIKVLEQLGSNDPVHYDSDKDKKAPDTCVPYKERLGKVCATYSISSSGRVVAKKSNYEQVLLGGVGDNPVVAFPTMPISIGHKWDVPHFVTAKDEYGSDQRLPLRVRYVLEKVVDGKAHITFDTDVLTPLSDETIRAQIVSHMARGFIVFDIANGVLLNRETRWDERVIGYQKAENYMHYTAFRNEVRVEEEKVAAKPAAPVAKVAKTETETKTEEESPKTHTLLQPMKK